MTVTTTTTQISYVGNGITREYTFPFKIQDDADLFIMLDGTTYSSGYSVSGAGDDNGGTVTFAVAPGNNIDILLYRNVRPLIQDTDLVTFGRNKVQVVEDICDRIVMAYQEYTGDGVPPPVVDVTDDGAIADNGVTDNAPIIQAAIDAAYEGGGGIVYLPSGQGNYYGISRALVLRHGVYLRGDGYWSWIKATTSGITWDAVPIIAGTYGGWQNADDMHNEASYDIEDTEVGTDLITMATAGEGSNFTEDQPVMIEDARTYTVGTNDYPTRSFMARIKTVAADTITLDRILPVSFSEVGGTKPRAYTVNTDAVDSITVPEGTSYKAFALERAGIIDMRIEAINDRKVQTIHFATFECEFRNLWLKGPSGIIGNPINWTLFENIQSEYGRMGMEMGYCSGDNMFRNVHWRRFADTNDASDSYGLHENWDGGGRNEYYGCSVDDHTEYSNGGILALFAKEKSRWYGGRFIQKSAAGDLHATLQISAGQLGEDLANDFTLRDTYIVAGNADGIVCGASRCVIEGNIVVGVDSSYDPIRLTTDANNCWVKGNRMGGADETGSHLKIRDDSFGTNGHLIDNIEIQPVLQSHHTTGTQAFTGDTAENSVTNASYVIPANTLRIGDTYQTIVKGNIAAGSLNGTKTIRVYWDSTVVYEYSFLAAQGTTSLPFEVIVDGLVYSTSQQIHGQLKATDGTVDFACIIGAVASPASAITLDVTVQLADAADVVNVRQVLHRPIIQKRLLDTGLQS